MVGYSGLVSQIVKNDLLVKATNDMVAENTLNLVTSEWDSRLENNMAYQDFIHYTVKPWKSLPTNNLYDYETTKKELDVVLVGNCRFAKPFEGKAQRAAVIISNSEPLAKIARAMTTDLGPDIQISNEFKFSFPTCGLLSCNDCQGASNQFSKKGYKLTKLTEPCILDTKVFDGKEIVNRFESQMEGMFPQSFLAILRLKIQTRYSYKNASKQKFYRISGNVLDIVGFNEAKLTMTKSVHLGDLTLIDLPVEKPLNTPKETGGDMTDIFLIGDEGAQSCEYLNSLPKNPKLEEEAFPLFEKPTDSSSKKPKFEEDEFPLFEKRSCGNPDSSSKKLKFEDDFLFDD